MMQSNQVHNIAQHCVQPVIRPNTIAQHCIQTVICQGLLDDMDPTNLDMMLQPFFQPPAGQPPVERTSKTTFDDAAAGIQSPEYRTYANKEAQPEAEGLHPATPTAGGPYASTVQATGRHSFTQSTDEDPAAPAACSANDDGSSCRLSRAAHPSPHAMAQPAAGVASEVRLRGAMLGGPLTNNLGVDVEDKQPFRHT